MKISTKGIYALEAMIELSSKGESQCISIRELAESRNCSTKYLEQIFKLMKTEGLVDSIRGKEGGYQLMKSPSKITVKDIILAVEFRLEPVLCTNEECDRYSLCQAKNIWQGMHQEIVKVLESKTLADLTATYLQGRSV